MLDSSSLLQGTSGRVGELIFYTVNGKTYFRYGPSHIANPKTEKQILQRNRLLGSQTLFRSVKNSILYDVFNTAAKLENKRSGYHFFLCKNINAFGPDDYIDYSRLVLSSGSLQLPYDFRLTDYTAEKAKLTWCDNSGQSTAAPTDRLVVAAIFPEEPFRISILPDTGILRRDEKATIGLPGDGSLPVHLYGFFSSSTGKAFSECRYFNIDH